MDTFILKCGSCESHTTHHLVDWSQEADSELVILSWRCKVCESKHNTKVTGSQFFGGGYSHHHLGRQSNSKGVGA